MVYHGDGEDEDETLDGGDEDLGRADEPAPAAESFEADADDLPEGDEDDVAAGAAPETRRKRIERILPELFKRAIERGLETGIGTLTNSRDALQGVVNKVELPKEVAGYVLSQVDETKNAMVRVVAREVREFLEAADLATELQRALTSLSFEIRTEIRFIPNDAGGVTPNVKAHVGPSRKPSTRRRRGERRPSAAPDAGDDEG